MDKALLEMVEHTADFETVMAARLSRIEEQLGPVLAARFEMLTVRLEAVEEKLGQIGTEQKALALCWGATEAHIARLHDKLDRLTSMLTLLQENLSPSVYPPNRTQDPPLVSG